ncbi:MAG: tetratricopeptide repeat protein, partial [Vampirovibrionia bacterium]
DINNFFYLSQMAYTLSQLGRYQESIDLFEYCIKINPAEIWTLQHYANALNKCNKKKEAINYFKKALEIAPYAIWPRKQLAECYIETNNTKKAQKEINTILQYSDLIDDNELLSEVFSIKAKINEQISYETAIDWYMLALKYNEEESYNYERLSSLLSTKFNDNINYLKTIEEELSSKDDELYIIASGNQRLGNILDSINIYKKALEDDILCYPAYTGISQCFYEKKFNTYNNNTPKTRLQLNKYVTNWDKISTNVQTIIYWSIKQLDKYLKPIIEKEGQLTLVPINTKLTSFPQLKHLQNELYFDGTPYQGIRALGGLKTYIGIERIRDITWRIPGWLKQVPATVAHEYAHQVYYVLNKNQTNEIKNIYDKYIENEENFISEYAKTNEEEFFAEYYAYIARSHYHFNKCDQSNDFFAFINNLQYNL